MRNIGTLSNENLASRFSAYLKHKGIMNRCEGFFDAQTGHMTYHLWVYDEDQIAVAAAAYERFLEKPSDPEFDAPLTAQINPDEISEENLAEDLPQQTGPLPRRIPTRVTTFFLALCALIFFINMTQEVPMREEGLSEQSFLLTPIQALLLYDLPPAIEQLEQVVEKHKIGPNQKLEDLPPEVKAELQGLEKVPFWRGFYDWFVLKVKGKDTSVAEGTLFLRIRQGEVWRLFSPAVLHRDMLHILFNMIWLWVLGRPIEQRIGAVKTLLLTLVCGIGSNTVQYLMSGPFFIGYSGIIMGVAGFIWMRQRIAPWEGYPLHRTTVLFLLIFVGAMFALQMGSLFFELFTTVNFSLNIANTAHIVGAIIGAALARLHFFAQKAIA